MKKICFFLPTLNFGGIEANTIRLAKSFIKCGYEVDLVVGNANGEYKKRIDNEINIISLNKKTLVTMLIPLKKYIKKKKPQVVITGGEGANILLSFIKILLPKAKIIISIRTNLTVEYDESSNIKKKLLYPFISRILYRKADKVVAVSEGVANDASTFLKIPINKINVIYNPILDNNLLELSDEQVQHRWLNDESNKVVLSVGRLVKQKDLKTLIQAYKTTKNNIENLKLLIIGEGPEREYLQKEIFNNKLESDVEILGFVQNPYSYMKQADLFVLSSKWEGFGNVLVEALSTGVPVLSTDCPSGPSEILGNGKFGSLAEVGNINDLSKLMLLELANNDTYKIELRKKRAKKFSVEESKIKYIRLINSIK